MTKLEEKLLELGYEKNPNLSFINLYQIRDNEFIKIIEGLFMIKILVKDNSIARYSFEFGKGAVGTPKDVDNYYNSLQILSKDLEILKGVE